MTDQNEYDGIKTILQYLSLYFFLYRFRLNPIKYIALKTRFIHSWLCLGMMHDIMFLIQSLLFPDIINRTDRLHSPATCSALLTKHPSTRSGMFYINPQGLTSSPSVKVYCDMTSKNGRAFFNIQAGGGQMPPQSPLVPPTKSHFAPPGKVPFS